MEKDTRVELTEERVREIVKEELAKILMNILDRSLEAQIKALHAVST